MKALTKIAIAATFVVTTGAAMADLSANIGMMSDYFYRGIDQDSGAVANGGIDYSNGGFNLGTWVADVSDGLEVDVYGGYGWELDSGFSVGVGVTGYYYTGDFDETYEEVNLSLGYGPISIGYSAGEWDGNTDYDFWEISYEAENGLYVTYGSFGDEFDGDYIELGYGREVGGFDVAVALILNEEELSNTGDDDESLTFSISKSFDL